MGFFKWLFGKADGTQSSVESSILGKGAPPELVIGKDDDSPQVAFQLNGTLVVMDREHYEYAYFESKLPNPAHKDLDELLPGVTRIRAYACGLYRGRPMTDEAILDTSDTKALSDFRKALNIVVDPATFSHCGCLGGPTLELLAGDEVVAVIGLQHGNAIRWNTWKHDARLVDGRHLNEWLTTNGVEPEMLDRLLKNGYGGPFTNSPGLRRLGPAALTREEQRLRLIEFQRQADGDLDRALAECGKVIAARPDLAFGHAVRGLIQHDRGKFALCAIDCSKAVDLGFRNPILFLTRAIARDRMGKYEEAESDCSAAIEMMPTYVDAYNNRGLIRFALGKIDDALADFAEAIRLAPQWGLPYINRAGLYAVRENWAEALADYDRLIDYAEAGESEIEPRVVYTAHLGKARVYDILGDQIRSAAETEAARRIEETEAWKPRRKARKPRRKAWKSRRKV